MNSYRREMDENHMLNSALRGRSNEHAEPRRRWFNGADSRDLFYAVPEYEAPR